MKKFRYYVALFVGSAPLGLDVETEKEVVTPADVLVLASQIRANMMQTARKLNFPPVVILNLVPCGSESPANVVSLPA